MPANNLRGAGANLPQDPTKVGLPARPFFYTVDQIAVCLNLSVETVKQKYLFFDGRSTGSQSIHLMVARNIAKPTDRPEWRIAEREFVRWLKLKKFKVYDAGVVTS